jgi:ketosteroid isomerase-like protein
MHDAQSELSRTALAWQDACTARDADRIASFFATDVCAMYPHPRPTFGREANRQAWANVFRSPDASHPISIETVSVSEHDNLGYNTGKWWFIHPTANEHVGGRYIALWRPVNGQWQIVHLAALIHDDVSSESPTP